MDIQTMTQSLWPQGNSPNCPQVYALLDGARDNAIAPMIWCCHLPYECLYAGRLSPELKLAAPYLVQLAPESNFFKLLFERGWGQSWGVYVQAKPDVTLPALRRHFRSLLCVQDEQGLPLLFRYYDPRVMRVYLPTCNTAEISQLLGPAQRFSYETEQGRSLLHYQPTQRQSC
jgi:hypothetical protein